MQTDSLDPQRHRQTIAAFNVYRTPGVRELLAEIQVSAWYQGILVESPAQVLDTHSDSVLFEVNAELGRALEQARFAFVESPLHGTCFRTRVIGLSHGGIEVELSQFEPFKDYMERRQLSRVAPVHAMLVRLRHGRFHLQGRVMDISVCSLAALFELQALERLTRLRSVELDVWGEYDVANALTDFRAGGEVLAVRHLQGALEMACHVVIKLELYPALDRVLKVYVARREREIMASLSHERFEQGEQLQAGAGA